MAKEQTLAAAEKSGESILYEGANLSQMCELFRCDRRTLARKITGIKPVGKRGGYDIYEVWRVAERMGKLTEEEIDAAMQRLNPTDLPVMMRKEYYTGQRAKQDYELRAGQLWPTVKVVEEVSEMVKAINMELNLLMDGIERQVEMTDRQREIATALVRGAKENMIKRLHEKFDNPEPAEMKLVSAPMEDDDEL